MDAREPSKKSARKQSDKMSHTHSEIISDPNDWKASKRELFNGEYYVKEKDYTSKLQLRKNEIRFLRGRLERLFERGKVDGKFTNLLKAKYPEIYWEIAQEMKGDFLKVNRIVTEEHGSQRKHLEAVMERDNNCCVRCFTTAMRIVNGVPISSRLDFDHIYEKVDGGNGEGLENLQILCERCHTKKTTLFQRLRAKVILTKELSHKVNQLFISNVSRRDLVDFAWRYGKEDKEKHYLRQRKTHALQGWEEEDKIKEHGKQKGFVTV